MFPTARPLNKTVIGQAVLEKPDIVRALLEKAVIV